MDLNKDRSKTLLKSEVLIKKSFSSGIITDFYLQLVPKLMEKHKDEQKVAEILKLFGRRLIIRFQDYWTPESRDVERILRETYRIIMRRSMGRVISVEKNRKWILVDPGCILCGDGTKTSNGLHYCVLMAGLFEGDINHLREKEGFEHLPKIRANTIASRSNGDKVCKHEIIMVE
ncbi:MAG: hypothetical protein ACTSRW_03670 [Candidatus Helarchaeota archaeon]